MGASADSSSRRIAGWLTLGALRPLAVEGAGTGTGRSVSGPRFAADAFESSSGDSIGTVIVMSATIDFDVNKDECRGGIRYGLTDTTEMLTASTRYCGHVGHGDNRLSARSVTAWMNWEPMECWQPRSTPIFKGENRWPAGTTMFGPPPPVWLDCHWG